MTKKFLAVTLVLVLAAGFMAVAADEDRTLTGEWENTLTLIPEEVSTVYWDWDSHSITWDADEWEDYYDENDEKGDLEIVHDYLDAVTKDSLPYYWFFDQDTVEEIGGLFPYLFDLEDGDTVTIFGLYDKTRTFGQFAAFDSKLTVNYNTGGISFTSISEFNLTGFEDQEFSADYTVGLLDLTSTLNLNPDGGTSAPLDYMENSGSLTLGGVNLSLTHLLQRVDWNGKLPSYKSSFWPEVSYSDTPTLPNWVLTSKYHEAFSMLNARNWEMGGEVGDYFEERFGVQTDSKTFHDYGSGLEFVISGETPGGVSVTATSKFGMMPRSEAEEDIQDQLKTMVKDDILDWTGEAKWANVTGEMIFNYVDAGFGVFGVPFDQAAAFFATELGVGDMVGVFESETPWDPAVDAAENSSPATTGELADDFFAYVNQQNDDGNEVTDAGSDISSNMKSGLLSHLTSQLAIAGVPTETESVVNTEFVLDQYNWVWEDTSESDEAPDWEPVIIGVDVDPGQYGGSALQYYSTKLELTGLSVGCCDFTNTTLFTEPDGFKYTEFGFSMSEGKYGLGVDATLKFDFDPDTTDAGKLVTLSPSITTDWACFDVYSELATSSEGASIDGLTIKGFGISAELGHVTVSSVTALGDYYLTDLSTDRSYHKYDEVLSFVKKDEYPLDFTLDVYTNMGDSLMPTALEGSATYPISDQFDLGSNIALTSSGLQEMSLSFDYNF